jgi:S-adenosylmethionine uptake transporter
MARQSRAMPGGPVLLYVIGVAVFCAMDAVMKHLVAGHPVVLATVWRYLAAIVFILPFWFREGRPPITREMLPINALRGATIALSAFLFFWGLSVLPLAEAVTIAFIAPLMIPPLAALFLGERMQAGNVAAGLIGFTGVLVAVGVDPSAIGADRLLGVAAVLLSAFTYALTIVITRLRAAKDGPSVLSLLGAIFPLCFLSPFLIWQVPAAQWLPRGIDWLWVGLAGLTGAIALQFIARAYARSEAQLLAPFEYTALFWAALFGWLFFSEPVSLRTWAGAAIIIAACLWQARRQAVPAPSSPAA